jgi:Outer membrane protein beta-barrel domain
MKRVMVNWKCVLSGCFMMLASTYGVMAQQARAGIKGGLNISNLYTNEVDDQNARYGFNVGVYGQLFANDVFAIQPEVLYSTKGAKFEDQIFDGELKLNLNYIDVPVLAIFKLSDVFEIQAGGYASYLLRVNSTFESNVFDASEDFDRKHFNAWDYGLVGGIGLNFDALQIGARYNYGLNEIAKDSEARAFMGSAKNSVAQVFLAINLNHGNGD